MNEIGLIGECGIMGTDPCGELGTGEHLAVMDRDVGGGYVATAEGYVKVEVVWHVERVGG